MVNSYTYHSIHPAPLLFEGEMWKELLKKPLQERVGYENGTELKYGQVVARFLGTFHDIDEYYNMLYDLSHDAEMDIFLLSEKLDKTIEREDFQFLQGVFHNVKENNLSLNRFIAHLESVLPKFKNHVFHRHLRMSLKTVLEHYVEHHKEGMKHQTFNRMATDLVKFTKNHIQKWIDEGNIETKVPRILWYGDATESQSYFLFFLTLLGFDVLMFHPEGKDVFELFDPEKKMTVVQTYPTTNTLEMFPKERRDRKSTIAHQTSMEIEQLWAQGEPVIFRPWQLRDYHPYPITLKTTYDELFMLIKERAFVRPEFDVSNGKVKIPNLFAKISGITTNKRQYWDRLQELMDIEESYVVQNFPFTSEEKSNFKYHYQNALGRDGKLDPEKMIKANWWKYKSLQLGLQLGFAAAVARCVEEEKLIAKPGESSIDVKQYILKQSMKIPEKIIQMIQTFDYPQKVPKIILYNTELNGKMSRSDATTLLILNKFGFDIVVYNPPGHTDLELYIDTSMFDHHYLDEMSFGQELKEPSFFKSFIKKLIN